jgi:heat shock protein HslJ
MLLVAIGGALATGLLGCAGADLVAGHEYLSVAVTDGGAARPLVAGTRIRLTFTDGQLGASAGCNHIGGPYRLEAGRLVVEAMAMTEMACEPNRDAQDQWLTAFLGSRPSIRAVGTELTLEAGAVVIRLVDRTVAEPDLPLAGTAWTLVGIQQGDAVSSIPAGVTATLRFNADGSFEVNTGCNQGGGKWNPVGGGISVSDLVLTKRACDAPVASVESAVVQVLRTGSVLVSIKASSLTLQAGAWGLQLQAG